MFTDKSNDVINNVCGKNIAKLRQVFHAFKKRAFVNIKSQHFTHLEMLTRCLFH